ncbi:MAG: hypothetical protein PHV51_05135, partial [Methanosarcinaceae archaeon]|nr:hypothetical protein [Methanosarcinaceae archaeon]
MCTKNLVRFLLLISVLLSGCIYSEENSEVPGISEETGASDAGVAGETEISEGEKTAEISEGEKKAESA